tara:strand:+ start:8098 stop:8538 length:441 start_codon:yes stop_codon:yes gene_type:complete
MESSNVQISTENQPNIDSQVSNNLGEIKQLFDNQDEEDKEMTNEEILKYVTDMIEFKSMTEMKKLKIINSNEYRKTFVKRYMRLHLNFPTIYNMVFENDNFELHRLKEMLSMRKNVEDKKISNFDASVKIGQKYTNEFIKKPLNID